MRKLQTQVIIQLVTIIGLIAYIGWKEYGQSDFVPIRHATISTNPNLSETETTELVAIHKDLIPSYKAFIIKVPDQVEFAGETISLDEPDLKERLDRELHVNANWHSNTILLIKKANRWLPQIAEILKENGIPEDFKYIPAIESGLEEHARSPKDAIGFWQLLKGTAKDYDLEVNKEVDERYDPIKSTEAACKYLKKAYEKFGSWANVAASYNIGMRGFERRLEEQRVNSYFDVLINDETARYLFRVLAVKMILENPEAFGFYIPEEQLYSQPELKAVTVTESIDDLVEFAHQHNITYKTLKRYNPWLRDDELTVKKKTYKIMISQDPAEEWAFTKK